MAASVGDIECVVQKALFPRAIECCAPCWRRFNHFARHWCGKPLGDAPRRCGAWAALLE